MKCTPAHWNLSRCTFCHIFTTSVEKKERYLKYPRERRIIKMLRNSSSQNNLGGS